MFGQVWGKKKEQEIRKAAFERYQVNENLLDMASKNVKFMHDFAHLMKKYQKIYYMMKDPLFFHNQKIVWSSNGINRKNN